MVKHLLHAWDCARPEMRRQKKADLFLGELMVQGEKQLQNGRGYSRRGGATVGGARRRERGVQGTGPGESGTHIHQGLSPFDFRKSVFPPDTLHLRPKKTASRVQFHSFILRVTTHNLTYSFRTKTEK